MVHPASPNAGTRHFSAESMVDHLRPAAIAGDISIIPLPDFLTGVRMGELAALTVRGILGNSDFNNATKPWLMGRVSEAHILPVGEDDDRLNLVSESAVPKSSYLSEDPETKRVDLAASVERARNNLTDVIREHPSASFVLVENPSDREFELHAPHTPIHAGLAWFRDHPALDQVRPIDTPDGTIQVPRRVQSVILWPDDKPLNRYTGQLAAVLGAVTKLTNQPVSAHENLLPNEQDPALLAQLEAVHDAYAHEESNFTRLGEVPEEAPDIPGQEDIKVIWYGSRS
ncbi:MAG TPA: hypothetical protein VK674_00930 [Candidatus Limnocylindria bacterium]|nr:hypothetical protein [Candidatus Limnocylindria bacterium]